MNGGQAFLTSARMQDFTMDKDTWVISISREITDATGENRGVLLIDLDYEVIEDYLANLDLGTDGFRSSSMKIRKLFIMKTHRISRTMPRNMSCRRLLKIQQAMIPKRTR